MYSIKLETAAQRGNNNLDLIRLFLAILVIYGHSFSVNPSSGMGSDILYSITGFHSGDIAIKGFFLISGFLVTDSILAHRSSMQYIVSRFFRIWPPLVVVVLLSALVMGPLVTSLSLDEYFADVGLRNYISKTITLQNWGGQSVGYFELPGVFSNNTYPGFVNAPLWSLNAEVFGYFIVLFVFLAGGMHRFVAAILFTLIIADSLLPEKALFYWLPQNSTDFSALPFCFAFGVIMSIFKRDVTLNVSAIVGLIAVNHFIEGPLIKPLLAYTILFLAIFLVASSKTARALHIPYDISYGVFLYGWPIQQIIAFYYPNWPHLLSLTASVLMAFVAGYLSCVFVEKPSQKCGKAVMRLWRSYVPANKNTARDQSR